MPALVINFQINTANSKFSLFFFFVWFGFSSVHFVRTNNNLYPSFKRQQSLNSIFLVIVDFLPLIVIINLWFIVIIIEAIDACTYRKSKPTDQNANNPIQSFRTWIEISLFTTCFSVFFFLFNFSRFKGFANIIAGSASPKNSYVSKGKKKNSLIHMVTKQKL